MSPRGIAIFGGGPAGLIAAETLARAGYSVTVHDRMPSPGRKFLLAGRGGLNLTHGEPLERFVERYAAAGAWLTPILRAFTPNDLRAWAEALGEPTFVGSSGRVFPESFKATPLLRAWLRRLDALGVTLRPRSLWVGWSGDGRALAVGPDGVARALEADASLLALGGASWPRLGSDGGWREILSDAGIAVAPLRPANCGFRVAWTDRFRARFAGQPLKPLGLSFADATVRGEAMITADGIEGGAIYALSALLREAVARDGSAVPRLDLAPDLDRRTLAVRLAAPRRGQSFSNFLRKTAGVSPIAIGLIREAFGPVEPPNLVDAIKALPLTLIGMSAITRAISTAGGVKLDEIDDRLMLRKRPGTFVAGEMLDWEAPTGGYLLQACFATGVAAARGILDWLRSNDRS